MDEIINVSIEEAQKNNKSVFFIIFEKVLPILLALVFILRLLLHNLEGPNIRDFTLVDTYGLTTVDLSKGIGIFTVFSIWLEVLLVILLCLYPTYKIKAIQNIITFIGPVISIINIININHITYLYRYHADGTWFRIVYLIEILLCLVLNIYIIVKRIIDRDFSIKGKDILIMIGIFFLLMIPTLPTYFLQFVFGGLRGARIINDITPLHRVFIYVGFIVPIVLYFALRNFSDKIIRFSLLFISLGVVVGFSVNYNYLSFTTPWSLPFHLCNTALYIIPICLIFKAKRLFYFTYFINVVGALFAIMMPNYADTTNIIASEMVRFWYNHWVAFFMPILIVALGVFERPKLKQFTYSMIAFAVYFILVLFMNVYFTAIGHEVNYFFLNDDFIPDKLGTLGKNVFNIATTLNIGGLSLKFHPLYQVLFFFVYVLLGLGELFIYYEFYKIADDHKRLHAKLKLMKENKWRFESILTDEDRQRIKEDNMETKLVLENVSKKYGNNKNYSVEDASFEVHGGEIFGFLGPNGAGKSTIIKSIVGIHPVTSGKITVCGYDVENQPVLAKYHIGYVPDHYALYEKLTGREYINYIADIFEVSKEERNERIEKYIHIFELENAIDNKIATYSHGMKQKITIMAALVHNPKVWILDEPLTGLDPNSIYQVKQCMKLHASEGNIVFFSSHLIDIVEKLCQRIAIIKKGHILCCRDVEEIEEEMSLEDFYMQTINGTAELPDVTNVNVEEANPSEDTI